MLQRAQRDNPSVNFVLVNNAESAQIVGAWLARQKLPLRNVLLDAGGRASSHFKQQGLPTTLFFDADGVLVSTRIGEPSLATLTRDLRTLRKPQLETNE